MKFLLGVMCGVVLVGVAWWSTTQLAPPEETATINTDVLDVFRFTIEDEVDHSFTKQAAGYTPELILGSFPGIVASDFAQVPANNGTYIVQDGQVIAQANELGLVPDHKIVLNRQGYAVLLENILKRLDMDIKQEHSIADVLEVIRKPRL